MLAQFAAVLSERAEGRLKACAAEAGGRLAAVQDFEGLQHELFALGHEDGFAAVLASCLGEQQASATLEELHALELRQRNQSCGLK